MPCKCSGVRYDRCACRVVGRYQDYQTRSEDRVVIVAQESACHVHPLGRNIWFRIYENLYERCAGYNLRYCPLRGVCTKNFLNETLRDLMMLLCFLMANFVVFLTIFARMTVHASFTVVASARWIRRSLLKKIMSNKEATVFSKLACQQAHNFDPPHKRFD